MQEGAPRKYLLLISLGPVQGFIATARRTRDLFAGSRLLSDAAHRVAKSLEDDGALLIFPAPSKNTPLEELKEAGIANVILAHLQKPRAPDELRKFVDGVEQNVRDFLKKEASKRLDIARNTTAGGKWGVVPSDEAKEAGLAQVEQLLEFYWVALPFDAEKDDYQGIRKLIYQLMNGRKNLRDFAPTDAWSKAVPKSSLDGALESVTSLRWVLDEEPPEPTKKLHNKAKLLLGLRPGEELSGVDLLKRLYLKGQQGEDEEKRSQSFASTTHMAALPFLQGLDPDKRETLIDRFEDLASTYSFQGVESWNPKPFFGLFKKLDPRLLFPTRYSEFGLEGDLLRKAQKEAANIFGEVGAEPYPYYAIIHADGDHMGKVIDALAVFGPERQRELSIDLAKFAKSVRTVVESSECLGSLVYSGGDDVLALFPLHTALECARKLADVFKLRMQKFKTKEGASPTFTVGLAVVHHLFDLGEALDLARRAEKAAKEKRNSLAVIVAPRSGVELLVKGSWDEKDPLDRRLAKYALWLHKGYIPTGWAYELRSLAEFMDAKELWEALPAEAIRTLKRKSKINKEIEDDFVARITLKGEAEEGRSPSEIPNEVLIAARVEQAKALARELIAARHFARAFALARKPGFERK